jgi:hypothetical protein
MFQVQSYDGDIHPELAETSGVFRELMSAGDELMTIGIDPATAVAVAAAVPLLLRLLRMGSEVLSTGLRDWEKNRDLERKRKDLELEREFGRK